MIRTRTTARASSAHARTQAWFGLLMAGALTASLPALSQQKTGPGIMGDDRLTWRGLTLYGVIDVGLQYETHGAPYSDYRPAASGNIIQKNSRGSVFGATPSNMGQSRVGLQGNEPLYADWSAVFQVETFFNPQSGELADSLKSLAVNNGKTAAHQTNGLDGSSAGQAFQTAFVGIKSARFGALTIGRQLTLLSEGTIKYDPNYDSNAFGLLGASNTYSGAGSSEDKRLDSAIKYAATFDEIVHVGALYKVNGSGGSSHTAYQADLGGQFAGASVDAFYSKIDDAISASALTAAQVAELPALGYSASNALSATVSDTTAFAVMALYRLDPLKFFAGYEHIRYSNPSTPLQPGFTDIGGYVLAFVTNNAYGNDKVVQVYWTGVRYTVVAPLELTAAYYGFHQNAYGTGTYAGCSTAATSACRGGLEAFSFDADYHFNRHFDAYAGAMYSGVHEGAASGYLHSTSIDPTVGVRYKF
jgi:predicted porin